MNFVEAAYCDAMWMTPLIVRTLVLNEIDGSYGTVLAAYLQTLFEGPQAIDK